MSLQGKQTSVREMLAKLDMEVAMRIAGFARKILFYF